MTIYQTLLAKGYFPKELPPAFATESLAKYAASTHGKSVLNGYSPADNYTECVKYRLARPGLYARELRIAHPASFSKLADLTAKNFKRLLKAANSPFSRSRPVYSTGRERAILPMLRPSNLARERASIRAGCSYLLRTDVSQFYPTLYTHAVGWAVDPKSKKKAHWHDKKLLGKQLDQALMDMDGKLSQGVPIGPDISLLLTEIVLARVDKALKIEACRAYRWYDDYEIAFDSRDRAELTLKNLHKELARFRLRLNAKKSEIVELPCPSQEEWQEALRNASSGRFTGSRQMVGYFDAAFRLREKFPDEQVLQYALGRLFKIVCPTDSVARIAQSCITQTLLCEPGAAQKAFALLSFWRLNGLKLNSVLLSDTVSRMVVRHQASGFSSDISWALAFCLERRFALNPKACQALSAFDDDCIALQSLHMERSKLLPKGFSVNKISKVLKDADLDREHWLIAYESVRHRFLKVCETAVKSHPLFSDLLKNRVTFYRTKLPRYATVIHPGGAPDWVVKKWMSALTGKSELTTPQQVAEMIEKTPLVKLIGEDLSKISGHPSSEGDVVSSLLETFVSDDDGAGSSYGV